MDDKIYSLVKENNKILKGMRRQARLKLLTKLLLLVALSGAGVWAYQEYIAPIVDRVLITMDRIQEVNSQLQGATEKIEEVQGFNLLEEINKLIGL